MASRLPSPPGKRPELATAPRVPRGTQLEKLNAARAAVGGISFGNVSTAGADEPSRRRALRAWLDYELCPEAGQIVNSSANLMSPCFMEIAIDGEVPTPEQVAALSGSERRNYNLASRAIQRRFGAPVRHGAYLSQFSRILDVPGDANLVGYYVDINGTPAEPPATGERWEILASDIVTLADATNPNDPTFMIERSPGLSVRLPKGSANVRRMFREDERHPDLATSWVVRAHRICVDLALFRMARTATGKSQILSDLLLVPSEASPEDPTTETAWGQGAPSGDVEEYADQIEEAIHEALKDALSDGREGRQVLPIVMAVEQEFIDAFTTLAISRKIDPEFRPTVEALRKELVEIADASPEDLFGLGDTNRWNGKQITEENFRRYQGPKVRRMAADITEAAVWLELKLSVPNITTEELQRYTVLVNYKFAVAPPDWSTLGPTLEKQRIIGPSGLRTLLGIADELAPTAAEKAAYTAAQPAPGAPPNQTGQEPANKGNGNGRQRDDTVSPDNKGKAGEVNTLAGAAMPELVPPVFAPQPQPDLMAERIDHLAAVERDAFSRLEEACEAAWDAAMTRAGNQFRSWVKGNPELKAATMAIEPAAAPDRLGVDRCVALTAEKFASSGERDAQIFGPALGVLTAAWLRISRQAWSNADLSVDQAELDRRLEDSVGVLRDSMVAALSAKVFGGWVAPTGADAGRIPKPILRRTMAVAGGTLGVDAGFTPDQSAAYGMLFGPVGVKALGVEVTGWRWDYGSTLTRHKVCDWHLELDGLEFSSILDPKLDGGPFGLRYPGDHAEDQCHLRPVVRLTNVAG